MDNFAFIIHPLDPKRDMKRKFPLLGSLLPVPVINFVSRYFPPLYVSHITGARSEATGKEVEGWFAAKSSRRPNGPNGWVRKSSASVRTRRS
jgi:fatty aldehyde-generating acyl-ACP reductase